MKRFICSIIASAILFGCASKPVVQSCPFPYENKPQVAVTKDDNVQFVLPDDFLPYKPHIWTSKSRNIIVMVVKNETDLSQDEYINGEISNLEMSGEIEVVANKKVIVKNKSGNLLVFRGNSVFVLNLIIVSKGVAHHVGCGSSLKNAEQALPVCIDILDTVDVR